MAFYSIKLPRSINGESLLEACTKAAYCMGFEVESKDEDRTKLEIGKTNPTKIYFHTDLRVKKRFLIFKRNFLKIPAIVKGGIHTSLDIFTQGSSGYASAQQVQDYINEVNEFLPKQNQQL